MSDELDLLLLVASRLDAASIPYMVSGSTAMNVYAEPRMTRDIDVVVEIGASDVDTIARAFAADFYCDRDMIRDAVDRQSSFNVIHASTVIKVDFIVRKDTAYRRVEFDRRRSVVVDGHTICVVAAEDLVLSKLVWGKPSRSELQLRDVRNLVACVPNLDWRYLERWAADLDVCDLLAEVQAVTDTVPAMADLQRRLLMERSGAERLRMGCDMFDAARALMRAGLGDATGSDRSPAMRVQLFERTYGRDFDPATAARIIAHLRAASD